MSDDIIEIKPELWGVKVNIRALLRRLKGSQKPDPVTIVAERFLTLFAEHGIAPAQIQQFLPQLTLDKLNSVEALLRALTNPVLDEAAALFKVRREWLDGVDDQIYRCECCYKNPERFFEILTGLTTDFASFPVRVLYSGKRLDGSDQRVQSLALVLVEKVRDFDRNEINRFVIFNDSWDWGHPPCRLQLKAIARLVNLSLRKGVPLYRVTANVLESVREGRSIPRQHLQGCLITNPALEDYGLSSRESRCARECTELPAVLDYITNQKLEPIARQLSTKGD